VLKAPERRCSETQFPPVEEALRSRNGPQVGVEVAGACAAVEWQLEPIQHTCTLGAACDRRESTDRGGTSTPAGLGHRAESLPERQWGAAGPSNVATRTRPQRCATPPTCSSSSTAQGRRAQPETSVLLPPALRGEGAAPSG
jgi:hypothetical protein